MTHVLFNSLSIISPIAQHSLVRTWREPYHSTGRELEIVAAPITTQISSFTVLVICHSEVLPSETIHCTFLSLVASLSFWLFPVLWGTTGTGHLLDPCCEPSTVPSVLRVWVPATKVVSRAQVLWVWSLNTWGSDLSCLLCDSDGLFNPSVS